MNCITSPSFRLLVLLGIVHLAMTNIQDGDKIKQEKVLELLDQYVRHVDEGRTDNNSKVLDLLDQYVMHVDKGADVNLEELERIRQKSDSSDAGWRMNVGHHWYGQERITSEKVNNIQNNLVKNREEVKRNNWKKIRNIDRVRRNLRGIQKKSKKELVKPKARILSTHGIKAKRSLMDANKELMDQKELPNKRSSTQRDWKKYVHKKSNLKINRNKRSLNQERDVDNDIRFKRDRDSEILNSNDSVDLLLGKWTHSVKLGNLITLSWMIKNEGDEMEILLEANTRGYVGVGFSPGGGMAGSDIIIGWVDDNNGKVYVVDSHGLDTSGAPVADPEQDCTLVGGRQNDSHTVVRFRRALDTCDKNHDFVLGGDTVRLIWATHNNDPELDSGELVGMTWHGKEHRGVRSLHLLNPPTRKVLRGYRNKHWDVTLKNFVVPDNMDTLYWCKIFKVPALQKKHHMIGYEPILQKGNERYIHHMLLYECVAPHQYASPDTMFQKYVEHPGASCYSPKMPQDWDQCMTAIVAWAVGSQGEFLPEHVGLPLADKDKSRFFMLEIHYDNPGFRKVQDNSGIRIHYTENLRQYDGGILVNGITITPLHIVPPHQPEYRTAGYCSSECTHRMFPQTGIKLVSVVLHSHLAGKKLRLRHIRAGRELPRIAEDDHYDFNYQQARILPQEVAVLPGDELVTECVYQTPNRTEPTFGGYSTKQEMCLAFVMYYPRIPLAACYSMTPVKYFFETFGVRQFYDVDMDSVERMFLKLPLQENTRPGSNRVTRSTTTTTTTTTTSATLSFPTGPEGALDEEANERAISVLKQMKDFTVEAVEGGSGGAGGLFGELVISEPDEFRNRSFTSHLVELPWTEKLLTQRVEESFYAGKHMVFCRMHDDQLAIPLAIAPFPNFTELPEDEIRNNTKCQEKLKLSLRIDNSSASKYSCSISCNILFQLTVALTIILRRGYSY